MHMLVWSLPLRSGQWVEKGVHELAWRHAAFGFDSTGCSSSTGKDRVYDDSQGLYCSFSYIWCCKVVRRSYVRSVSLFPDSLYIENSWLPSPRRRQSMNTNHQPYISLAIPQSGP